MPSAVIPATPHVMMLLCLIARVMRGMGPSNLGMQVLMVGAVCPSFGAVLRTWLDVEEHVARAPESDDPWWGVDLDAGDGDVRSGWIGRTGLVWRWRQVSGTGIVTVMLMRWFEALGRPDGTWTGAVWAPCWRVSRSLRWFVFSGGVAAGWSFALFVPVV